MRSLVAAIGLVPVVALAACGGSGEVQRSAAVARGDVTVGTDLSWASCEPVTSSEPDSRPGGGFFAGDAPDDGDLVPAGPVSAAFCTSSPMGQLAGGRDLELTGSSLDALVNALNHSPRYDGDVTCNDQGGASNRVVFRYADDHVLPVLLSRDSCGWADNGVQIRYNLELYLSKLDRRLDQASG
jgi:hypothetical protein